MEIYRLNDEELIKLEKLSEEERYRILEKYYTENTSHYYFPGNLIAFYPYFEEKKASKDIICDFSERVISKGTVYVRYRPLIENMTTKTSFVLKRSIKCEQYYEDILPRNISEFEILNDTIMNSNISSELSYENLRAYGGLSLTKLKRRNL